MKVKEIIDLLSKFPPNIEVFVPSRTGDYDYGITYDVARRDILLPDGFVDGVVIDEC